MKKEEKENVCEPEIDIIEVNEKKRKRFILKLLDRLEEEIELN